MDFICGKNFILLFQGNKISKPNVQIVTNKASLINGCGKYFPIYCIIHVMTNTCWSITKASVTANSPANHIRTYSQNRQIN
jgi:hypothetical protein